MVLEAGGYDETLYDGFAGSVVARVLAGQSVRSVALALSTSAATVVRWSQRYRATGSASPVKVSGYKPNLLAGMHRDWLLARAATDSLCKGWSLRWRIAV